MKVASLRLMLYTAILIAVSAVAHAQDKNAVSQQELQAKIDYCKTCHGFSGQGYRGFYPMPRLAGQQSEYIDNQLHAFIERRRQNPVMFNVAHVLNPGMVKGLAAYFGSLNPKPLGGLRRNSWPPEKRFMKKGLPRPTFLPARPATARRAKVTDRFLVSPASSMTTS
jgi:cytochrome c553